MITASSRSSSLPATPISAHRGILAVVVDWLLCLSTLISVVYCPQNITVVLNCNFSCLSCALLICGDFNIHVCCPDSQPAREFLSVINSFDLTQSVCGPTHRQGHTLDLIISHGLPVSLTEISKTCISDHYPILFDFSPPPPAPRPLISACRRRIITSSTASHFASAFTLTELYTDVAPPTCPDNFISSFYSTCSNILDTVAPFRNKTTRIKPEPWLNDTTRELRQCCRQADRRYKKDRLQVSLQILRENLDIYQKAVQEAKRQYLSNIISTSSNNPKV